MSGAIVIAAQMARPSRRYKHEAVCYRAGAMRLLLPLLLLASACTFGGGGLVPSGPVPAARVAEDDLEVPYVPTPRPVVAAMLDLAEVGADDYLIDLGSGDGRIAIMAAQRGARALGVDLDPARVSEAAAAAAMARVATRAQFRRQDLFATPLGQASVVSLYLLPDVNMRLRPRLLTELRPGARIVSHAFTMGDWRPDASREVNAANIFLWIVPAVAEGRWVLETADGARRPLELEQRFQDVTGTLDGRPLQNVALRGRSLRFMAVLPDGPQTFRGLVGDAEIVADPGAPPDAVGGWRARRVG